MRILLSLENGKDFEHLTECLYNVLKVFDSDEVFIDMFHVHPMRGIAKVTEIKEIVEEIHADEFKHKVETIAKMENQLEKHLAEKLNKAVLVNSLVVKGDYQTKLHDRIIFQRYDLLVLNPPKKNNFDLILHGSNTHWVIDSLEVPILILPKDLKFEATPESMCICFVDNVNSFNSIKRSQAINFINPDKLSYKFFGKETISEEVETIFCSDPLKAISEFTSNRDHHNICIMHHRNKGDFLNFLDKSFTKHLIKSLENPLIIF